MIADDKAVQGAEERALVADLEPAPRVGAEPPPRKSWLGRVVVLAVLAALAVWIGVRVQAAMKTQGQLAQERTEQARTANDTAAAPVLAKVVRGTKRSWLPAVPLEGTLAPVREADLGFKLPGRLQSIRVRMGEYVRQGATLATLDSTGAGAQERAAEAQLKAAQAQLALSDDSERRTSALVESGAQAQVMGVQSSKQRELAATQAEAARAQLELVSAALADHRLPAPFSGYLTKVPSGQGAIVGPGVPLFHLQDVSTLKLVGSVGEADAALVRVGAKVSIQLEGRTVEGRVTAVLASVDPVTRRLPVEAQVQNDPKAPILAGSFVRASIHGQHEIPVLALPAQALRPGSQGELMVFAAGRLQARKITFVTAPGGELLVRAGLDPEEQVVLAPSPEARDGDPATVTQ